MVPLLPTFQPMVSLATMVPLAAEKRSGFSGYQWYQLPMVPLEESRTHALSGSIAIKKTAREYHNKRYYQGVPQAKKNPVSVTIKKAVIAYHNQNYRQA